jgi:methyl-accepting chemotaxis protein
VQDVGNKVRAVDDRVQDIGRDVRGDVQDVGSKVQGVEDKVQGIGSDVKDISSEVRGVDDKSDQANRSWNSLTFIHLSERPDIFTGNQLKDNLLR